jgi:hypothetical protein
LTEARFDVNASPLIFLTAIDALELLPLLAGKVLLPEAVLGEVLGGSGSRGGRGIVLVQGRRMD